MLAVSVGVCNYIFSRCMKHFLITIACLLLLAGCKNIDNNSRTIAVSILPQKYFLEQIVGDKFNVLCLLSPGANPEAYEPDMAHLMNLESSEAFFKIGNIGFELAISDRIKNNNPDLKIYDNSKGVALIHGSHSASEGHNHDIDPHIWTSVGNARIIAKNMLDAVEELDPDNSKTYEKNFARLSERLDTIDARLSQILAPKKGTAFLVWHPSLTYFAHDYDLVQISLEYDGKEASPAHIKHCIDEALEHHARVFFYQQEFDSRQVEALNEQIKAKIVPTNLLGYNWEDEMYNIANAIAAE